MGYFYFPGSSRPDLSGKVVRNEPPDDWARREPVVHQKRELPPVVPFTAKATLRTNLKPYLGERLDSERGASVIAEINAHLSATKQPYCVQTIGNEVCLCLTTEKAPEVVGRIPSDQCAFNDFFYRGSGDPEENLNRINGRFDISNQPGYKLISDKSGRILLRNENETVADIGSAADFGKKSFFLDLRKGESLEVLLVKTFVGPQRVCGVSTQTKNAQECGTTVGVPNSKRGSLGKYDEFAQGKLGYDKGTPSQPRHAKVSQLVAEMGRYVNLDITATLKSG